MNTFAVGSLPVHFSVAKLFNFRWQYTSNKARCSILFANYTTFAASNMSGSLSVLQGTSFSVGTA